MRVHDVLRARRASAALGLLAGALALAIVALRTPLLEHGLSRPFLYSDDGLFHLTLVEALRAHGLDDVPRLGLPFGMSLRDVPMAETTSFVALRALLLFHDPGAAFNLFYLLGFVGSAWTATYVARRERLHPIVALFVGVAFALAPYHFHRLSHLFLASYACVPLFVGASLDLARGAPRLRQALTRPPGRWGVALAVLVTSGSGLYYAFFACALGAFATTRGAYQHPRRGVAQLGASLVGATAVLVLLQLLPHLGHARAHGPAAVGDRAPWEAEVYGLKPLQLFLPTRGHTIDALADVADRYAISSPLTNENATASLGLLAAAGVFLALLAVLLGARARRLREPGWLAMVAIALGTVGGIGAAFAYLVHPGMRSVNRISIVVAYVGLLALGHVAQRAIGRLRGVRTRRAALVCSTAVALALATLDQIPTRGYRPDGDARRFLEDRRFFRAVERAVPRGARVLVLPHATFPEGRRDGAFGPYDGLRPFLASRALRTSAGAIPGRAADVWSSVLARLPTPRLVALASRAGFDLVLVGRAASSSPARIEALRARLGAPLREDASWSIFRIPRGVDDGGPPLVAYAFGAGFLGSEGPGRGRWTEGDAELLLAHAEARPVRATISMRLYADDARGVAIEHGGVSRARVTLAPREARPASVTLTLARGLTRLRFRTYLPTHRASADDPRAIAFAVSRIAVRVDDAR